MEAPSSAKTVVMPIFLPMRPFMLLSSRFLLAELRRSMPRVRRAGAAGGSCTHPALGAPAKPHGGVAVALVRGPRLLSRGAVENQARHGDCPGTPGEPDTMTV